MIFFAARPDFGFGNPNTAAAFFALLAVGLWGCFVGNWPWRKERARIWFWVCLVLSTLLGGLIVATASRGGLVALGAGLSACWIAAGVPRPGIGRLLGVLAAVLILAGMAVSGRMGARVAGSSLEDGSITSRLTIYAQVPAMMAAAPGGWGAGKAAEAYHNWFQAKEDTRIYKHLVSTHATWLVEAGWGLRLAYVWGWLAVLLICWKNPAAFGVWVAFGVAGVFSHVGADGRLWVLPVVAGIWALAQRVFRRELPPCRVWVVCTLLAGGLMGAVAGLGAWQAPGVRYYGGHLTAGNEPAAVWFWSPDPAVLGRAYGKLVRGQGAAGVFWEEGNFLPDAPFRLVLSGNPQSLPLVEKEYDLIWLNPPGRLSEPQRAMVEKAARKVILWGELRTDASARETKAWVTALAGSEWRDISGAGALLWKLPNLSGTE